MKHTSDAAWGGSIFGRQEFTVCRRDLERSFADRMEDEIRALAAERRQQIADDMRNGAPARSVRGAWRARPA